MALIASKGLEGEPTLGPRHWNQVAVCPHPRHTMFSTIISNDHFKRSPSDSWFPQGNLHDRSLLPTSLNSILPLFCSFTLLPPYWPPLSSSRCCNPCCKQPHYFPPKVLNFPSPFLVFSSSWGISLTLSSSVQHPQKAFPDYIIKWTLSLHSPFPPRNSSCFTALAWPKITLQIFVIY